MKPNPIIFCAAALCAALVSCGEETALSERQPAAFVCRLIYEDAMIELPTGETLSVVLEEGTANALKLLRTLKPSLQIGLSPSAESGMKPRLYLVGEITKRMSKPPAATAQPMPWKAQPIFRLDGWFVEVPYTEYPQVPEYEPQPGPRERKTLEATDFEPSINPMLIQHDQKRGLFWLGIEPPATLPRPVK